MANYTFTLEAGAMIRGSIRRALKQYCFEHGYKLKLDEDKGWLESLFTVDIEVPDHRFQEVNTDVLNFVNQFKEKR